MIQLTRLVNDIFDDRELTDANLRTYADDHLIRLANKNPNSVYAALIADTTSRYTDYYGSMTSEATKEAISEGLTIARRYAEEEVLAKLSRQRDLIAYKFGTDSPIYQQFFPQGMDEYRRARLDDLTTILDRYMAAATVHLTPEFPLEVAEMADLVLAYNNARTAQRDAFSETENLRTGRRESRKALTLQLTRNILTLAIDFLEDPDGFDDYFDARLLPMGTSSGSDDDDDDTPATTTLLGTVTDSATQSPLAGVLVRLITPSGELSATTAVNGGYKFNLTGIPETLLAELQVSLDGYAGQNRPVVLEQGSELVEDFQLTKAS